MNWLSAFIGARNVGTTHALVSIDRLAQAGFIDGNRALPHHRPGMRVIESS